MWNRIVGACMLFRKKTLETTRVNTHKTLFDVTKAIETVYAKAKNEKYKKYLHDLKEKTAFSVNNNKKITVKDFKKFVSILNDIYSLLGHEKWHSGKIKKKLRRLETILASIL